MKIFLLDIEGTTVPISFVHEILFPFARERIVAFLEAYELDLHEFTEIKQEFEKDIVSANPDFLKLFPKMVSFSKKNLPTYLCYLIDVDRKFGPLKKIQGKIWQDGYEKNLIKSTLFADVPDFLKKANEVGISCYVYSSGSVQAQKLIYKYSNFGDLTASFKNFFDTSMGGKKETQSYLNIAHHINANAADFVFFTDIVEEADAAKGAGMETILLDRPGNTKQPAHTYKTLKDLLAYF
jgi:enolase-phosphatase E1